MYLERITQAMRLLGPLGTSVPIVLLGPSPYAAAAYPSQRPHAPAVAAARRWAGRHDVGFVDLDPLVGPSLSAGMANPDGVHWGWAAHRAVGEALAAALAGT
jgi:diglucosylglycerate octanoyltransferase